MKRKCKQINITNSDVIYPWVLDCCQRHYGRHDFQKLFERHGMSKQDYHDRNYKAFEESVKTISTEAAGKIIRRNLDLPPVRIRIMADSTTGKIRQIGCESAMQQVFDYIAVKSCMEIFKKRMVREQASSIPGRGQIYGMRIIHGWVKDDIRAAEYAKKHNLIYKRKCTYFVKLDIRKCYPSANSDIFLKMFERDCGNPDILWLWAKLLHSHKVDGYTGMMIGALPSQWACQYMLSYLYRYAKSGYKLRRGKRILDVEHMLMFMDDMLLIGSNRNALKKSVERLITYTKDTFGWDIKPDWHIREFEKFNIDMMGYVIHNDGHVTIRSRDFIRSRRLALKNIHSVDQARRLLSYKGFYKYSDSIMVSRKYHLKNKFHFAALLVSIADRKENRNGTGRCTLRRGDAEKH